MQRSPDIALDDSLAREVAVREDVKAIVTGRIAGGGAVHDQLRSGGRGEGGRPGRISRDRRGLDRCDPRGGPRPSASGRIGESLAASGHASAGAGDDQVARCPPGVFRGGSALKPGTGPRHIGSRAAVPLDTGFASAYRVLGVTYGDMVEIGRAATALAHAVANQSRLPFYERYHAVATHASAVGRLGPRLTPIITCSRAIPTTFER